MYNCHFDLYYLDPQEWYTFKNLSGIRNSGTKERELNENDVITNRFISFKGQGDPNNFKVVIPATGKKLVCLQLYQPNT